MKRLIRKVLTKAVPEKVKRIFTQPLSIEIELLKKQTICYAQEGEDLILETFFQNVGKGFYIDIGAYHPVRFSNTYLFYLKGWRGINIDASPGSMDIFKTLRPEDINVEVAIGKDEKTLTYYMFDESALNGFSKEISEYRHNNTRYKIQQKIELPLKRLETVLNEHIPLNSTIHFMDIDVEGLDLDVLQSNNWNKYKPLMMLVETSLVSDGLGMDSPIHLFLSEKGYRLVAKTFRTSFYKLQ
ncbi:MAG: FkbM family methyltransferase [Ginsengibacter sp.]